MYENTSLFRDYLLCIVTDHHIALSASRGSDKNCTTRGNAFCGRKDKLEMVSGMINICVIIDFLNTLYS